MKIYYNTKQSIFQILLPLVICGISFACLIPTILRRFVRGGHHLLVQNSGSSFLDRTLGVRQDDENFEELQEFTHKKNTRAPINSRPLLLMQSSICIFILSIEILAAIKSPVLSNRNWVIIGSIICWTYILFLSLFRFMTTLTTKLWYHVAWIYSLRWFIFLPPFRSAMLQGTSLRVNYLWILELSLLTILLLSTIAVGRSEWISIPRIEKYRRLSRIKSSSVLGLLSFAWLDPILSEGYRKPLEAYHIPELESDDRGAEVVMVADRYR